MKLIINKYFKQLENDLTHIQKLFNSSTKSIHKARNELRVVNIQNISCVIKSFKVPNIINQVAYSFFRDSKAKKSYEYSLKIGEFTPKPIGYIEFYSFGLLKNSYFVSEEFKYEFTIREPLLDKSFPNRDEIFKAFARFTLELHNRNIYHNDYSPGNILIKKVNDDFIFKIVDINRMTFKTLTEDERAKNFSKLWANNDILRVISAEYTKYYKCSANFQSKVIRYSQKHKDAKNLKKRLKGQEVND